jgi:hypothetical protein
MIAFNNKPSKWPGGESMADLFAKRVGEGRVAAVL